MPSTDTMVLLGSSSVALVMAWTTASVPARVDRAYWCGEQAWWMCWENCCARLRATNLRRRSPITRPRTRPLGFWRATRRPRPSAWPPATNTSGTCRCHVAYINESFVCGERLAAGHRKYVLRSFGGLVPTKMWINSQERIAAEKAGTRRWPYLTPST